MNKQPMFLHTFDKEEALKLEELGYESLHSDGTVWTFIEKDKIDFANVIDNKKVIRNNMLYI